MQNHDGTLEFVSRGSAPSVNAKALMQRLPADQAGGAASMTSTVVFVQDQNFNTAETIAVELRGNNPAGPATGSPDMSAAGLLGTTGNLSLQFPTPQTGVAVAVFLTVTFATPIAVPQATSTVVPAADLYVGVVFPPSPTWPATDGISCGASGVNGVANPGELMNPAAVGYTGAVGAAGLGWQADLTTAAAPLLATNNRAWFARTRWTNAVLHPFAFNAAVFTGNPTTLAGPGLNPNFGYAGLFPMMARAGGPDGMGFRARYQAPIGTPTMLIVAAFPFATPVNIFGTTGNLCLDLTGPFFFVETKPSGAPPAGFSLSTSETSFGPYPGNVAFPTGVSVYMQTVTLPAVGQPEFSSMCKITL